MKLFLIHTFCLLNFLLNAQGFKTRIYIPHSQNMMSQSIYETSPGNYLASGVSYDTVNGQVTGNLVMMGLNSSGNLMWTKKYAGYGVNTLALRSFYRKGNYLYRVGVGLGSNGKNFGNLLKINFNGDTIWQRNYYDSIDGLVPQMVTASVDGGFLITGFYNNSRTLLLKTDANGNELWRRKISKANPNVSDGQSILQDSATKKIIITGYQYLTGTDTHDNILITDSLGNNGIRTNYCTNVGGLAKDLIQTKDKKFVATGIEYFPQSIGGNPLMKGYVAKFNHINPYTPIWKFNFGKLLIYNAFGCLRELSNGDIIVAGIYDTLLMQNKLENTFISAVKIDTSGKIKWQSFYNYKYNSDNIANDISVNSLELTSDGGFVISIIGSNFSEVNPFFFVKFDGNGCDSSVAHCATLNLVGGKELRVEGLELKVWPNPANEVLNIESNSLDGDIEIKITDVLGKVLIAQTLRGKQQINTRLLSDGIYFINFYQSNKWLACKKIIKQD